VANQPIADFFDRECCSAAHRDAGSNGRLEKTAEHLLDALGDAGYRAGSVLEIGSGDGSLSRELVRRGASSVTGLDLSPQSVAYASLRAASAGLAERLTYRITDASTVALESHDAIVSEKVFCCFPDADTLLANTLPAARSFYALVLPESRGVIGFGARVFVAGANAWQWLSRDPFRVYIHDVRRVDETIRAAGFRRRASRRHLIWRVLAYSRS
jgi:SAM-dependent methyltransferase